jgi:hypothetical protein
MHRATKALDAACRLGCTTSARSFSAPRCNMDGISPPCCPSQRLVDASDDTCIGCVSKSIFHTPRHN